MKFTEEEIIGAVKRVLENGRSVLGAAKSIGMSRSTLRAYVERANVHGYSCLVRSANRRKFDGKFKVHVVEFTRENSLSSTEAAAHFNIARSVFKRWEHLYLEEGSQALFRERRGRKKLNKKERGRPPKLDRQIKEDLIAENQRLKMENEFLKKLNALVQEREKRKEKK
jgi:transposase